MLHVIDVISTGSDNLTFVIKDFVSGSILWTGTLRDFIRELTMFFIFYAKPVQRISVEVIRSEGLLILYI